MVFDPTYPRSVPERRPAGHQPAAPRFSLRWTKPVSMLTSVYFGIQARELDWQTESGFFERLRGWFDRPDGPQAHEIMRCEDENGYINGILVAYWTHPGDYANWHEGSGFDAWFGDAARLTEPQGYWRETISVPYDRHETIYSGPHYPIGIARTKDTVIVSITTNGYFGAARDRLPLSAIDELESPLGDFMPAAASPRSEGARLLVTLPHNVAMLRSGQFWEGAGQAQHDDYLQELQPKLMRGMNYLRNNKADTGCMSLRTMINLNEDGSLRAETSVAAYFLSMTPLEKWAASHQTHLDIYQHAIAMNRLHKEKREVITWHELFVLQEGHAFDYVNCHPQTGMLPYGRVWKVGE